MLVDDDADADVEMGPVSVDVETVSDDVDTSEEVVAESVAELEVAIKGACACTASEVVFQRTWSMT